MSDLNNVDKIVKTLKKKYPNPRTELIYENEYQLAVAVMLSAQTTDKKVNQVTPRLFKKYPYFINTTDGNNPITNKPVTCRNQPIRKSDN